MLLNNRSIRKITDIKASKAFDEDQTVEDVDEKEEELV